MRLIARRFTLVATLLIAGATTLMQVVPAQGYTPPTPHGYGDPGDYRMQPIPLDLQTTAKVNLADGNLFVSSADLKVKGVDIPFTAEQEWNSLEAESGHVQRWYGGIPHVNVISETNVEVQLPHYDRAQFLKEGASWIAPPGIQASLCVVGVSGCTGNASDEKAYTKAVAKYALTFNHAGSGALAQESGKLTFDASGTVLSEEDRYANAIVWHTSKGVLTKVVDTEGRKFETTTETLGGGATVISHWEDVSGKRNILYSFNSGEQETGYTDAEANTTKYAYNTSGGLESITDPLHNKTEFSYNSAHQVTQIVRPEVGGTHPTWKYAYYEASSSHGHACTAKGVVKKTVVTDPNSHESTYCANTEDQVVQSFDPLGDERSGEYSASGQVTGFQAAGASGLSKISYNELGDATKLTDASGTTQTSEFTDTAYPYQATEFTDGIGATDHYCRAGESPVQTACPAEASKQPGGTLTAILEGPSETPIYTYAYNEKGELETATDHLGNATAYKYDSKGNLIRVTPPVTSPLKVKYSSFTSDAVGRLESTTEGNGYLTTYTYNKLDELASATFQDKSTVTYKYDADGNLTSRIDSAGVTKAGTGTTEYEYDALNRLKKETLPGATTNQYGYDGAGNITSLVDPTGTARYGYNQANEMNSLAEPGGSCEAGKESLCSHFTYDVYGNPHTTTLANGDTVEEAYTAAGRAESIKATSPTYGTLTSFKYTYEGGLIHTESDKLGDTTTYHYEGPERLAEAVETGPHAASWKISYNANGDTTAIVENGVKTTYTYNADSETCWSYPGASSNSCESPPSGAKTYTYDHAGDLTADSGGDSYSYNDRQQMNSLTIHGSGGETAWEQSFGGIGQSELTSTGPRTFQNNKLGLGIMHGGEWGDADYVHEPDGRLFSTKEAGRRQYYLFDALGSVVALASNGEHEGLGAYIAYDPFGDVRENNQNMQNYFWFAGGYPVGTLYESGPQGPLHFGERFYTHNTTGTWTQRDSVAHPAEPAQYDPYVYAGDNPVNRADPSGHGYAPYIYGTAGGIGGTAIGYGIGGALGGPGGAAVGGFVGGLIGSNVGAAAGEFLEEELEE